MDFRAKKKRRQMLYSKPVLIGLALALVLVGFGAFQVYMKSRSAVIKNDKAKKELADLERRKKELEERIARLETPAGLEEELRKKFNVSKPDENVLVIVEKGEEKGKIEEKENTISVFFFGILEKIKGVFR